METILSDLCKDMDIVGIWTRFRVVYYSATSIVLQLNWSGKNVKEYSQAMANIDVLRNKFICYKSVDLNLKHIAISLFSASDLVYNFFSLLAMYKFKFTILQVLINISSKAKCISNIEFERSDSRFQPKFYSKQPFTA